MPNHLTSVQNLWLFRRSVDGIIALTKEALDRLGLNDVTTTVANAIGALENATTKGYTKKDLNKMVKEAVANNIIGAREDR